MSLRATLQKKLLCQPAGPRPPKRDDGYGCWGPQGVQNVRAKASVKAASSVLPPPPPVPPAPKVVAPKSRAYCVTLPKFLPAAPLLEPQPKWLGPHLPSTFGVFI